VTETEVTGPLDVEMLNGALERTEVVRVVKEVDVATAPDELERLGVDDTDEELETLLVSVLAGEYPLEDEEVVETEDEGADPVEVEEDTDITNVVEPIRELGEVEELELDTVEVELNVDEDPVLLDCAS